MNRHAGAASLCFGVYSNWRNFRGMDMGPATRAMIVMAVVFFVACMAWGVREFYWQGVNYDYAPKEPVI
jgi:hypothetical protein